LTDGNSTYFTFITASVSFLKASRASALGLVTISLNSTVSTISLSSCVPSTSLTKIKNNMTIYITKAAVTISLSIVHSVESSSLGLWSSSIFVVG
jgi:hypothetical protein